MRLSFKAVVFLFFVSISSASAGGESGSLDITSVPGVEEPDHVSIVLSLPCKTCPSPGDIELTLQVDVAENECGIPNAHLNGVPFWTSPGDNTSGSLILAIDTPHEHQDSVFEAVWSSTCLDDQASLISVSVHEVSNAVATLRIGFATSFKQTGRPSVLKLQGAPLQTVDNVSSWLHPQEHERLRIHPYEVADDTATLEDELLKLQGLVSTSVALDKEIRDVQSRIISLWKADLARCTSFKCYIQTILKKAPPLAHMIATHFRHHKHIAFFYKPSHSNDTDKLSVQSEVADAQAASNDDHLPNLEISSASAPTSASEFVPSLQAEEADDAEGPVATGTDNDPYGRPPWGSGPPPWAKHGSPPWGSGPPPWAKHGSPWWAHNNPPPWAHDISTTAPGEALGSAGSKHNDDQSHTIATAPVFGTSISARQEFRIRLISALATLVVICLIGTCLWSCIRRKSKYFSDPRRLVDRAARREERRTRKLYHKAACKYQMERTWLNFLGFFARIPSNEEEKSPATTSAQSIPSSIVQSEISNLRAAHDLVGEMIRAEEGNSPFRIQTRTGSAEFVCDNCDEDCESLKSEMLPTYSAPPGYASQRGGSSSIVSYTSPPGYNSEREGSISIVDGFTITSYTPSATEETTSATDETPDQSSQSSVVDCSPRLSFQSVRTSSTLTA